MLLLVVAAVLLGSFLLFLVEPMAAKMLLPRLGGSPSVWVACMLFFQAALLVGYGYAHLLVRRLQERRQALVHAVLLLACGLTLPPQLPESWSSPGMQPPVLWVLGALALTVGLPFVALACTGPLLQRWYAAGRGRGERDPYFLYAAGNVGSLAGLLAYPTLVEPRLPLTGGLVSQNVLWSVGFGIAAAATLAAGAVAGRTVDHPAPPLPDALVPPPTDPVAAPRVEPLAPPTGRQALEWTLLALVPSSVLLGGTQFMTTDIAAIPFLWVLPLALYLLTFVVAFSPRVRIPEGWTGGALALAALAVIGMRWMGMKPAPATWIPVHLAAIAAAGLLCHGRLAARRPAPAHLTSFYWWIAVGGALGGVFNGLLAPVLFDDLPEYPLALLAACALRRGTFARRTLPGWLVDVGFAAALALAIALVPRDVFLWGTVTLPPRWLAIGATIALALAAFRPLAFVLGLGAVALLSDLPLPAGTTTLHQARTFFGVHRVLEVRPGPMPIVDAAGTVQQVELKPYRALFHGTTSHGTQYPDPELRKLPTTYYHRTGPLGQVFETFAAGDRLDRVGVIGLGAGTIAAYGRPGRTITFFEIDPEVVRIARNPAWFTYLADSAGRVEVVVADGRAAMAGVPDGSLGLLVLDAFSSDAIPIHLVTREAVRLYAAKLRPDGLLAAHVSNRHLDLARVLAAVGADLGLAVRYQKNRIADFVEFVERKETSDWVLLARDEAALGPLAADPRWTRLLPPRGSASRYRWTDRRSDLLGIVKER